ncbi:MAG TPA: hypothetical protein VMY42_20880 [Thermoguttaceae bacterium]|nr:hypothetical protein [Thermoguttaceae bacterium]
MTFTSPPPMYENPRREVSLTVGEVEYNNLVLQAAGNPGNSCYLINPETINIICRAGKSRSEFDRDVRIAHVLPGQFASPVAGVVFTPEARELVRLMRREIDLLTQMAKHRTGESQEACLSGEGENTNAASAAPG